MFYKNQDQVNYIIETYPEVTDHRVNDAHWDLHCPQCKTTRGFQVIEMSEGRIPTGYHGHYSVDSQAPQTIYFRCPVCKAYKQWIVYKIAHNEGEGGKPNWVNHYYRVASLPSEGIED